MNTITDVSFKIQAKELKSVFSQIMRLGGRQKSDLIIRIRILEECIEISREGIMRRLAAATEGTADVSLPANLIQAYLSTNSVPVIGFLFRNGALECGSSVYTSNSITVNPLFADQDNGLPLNKSDQDLILIGYTKTETEIESLGLSRSVQIAFGSMKNKILEAEALLAKYGVKYDDLEAIIKKYYKA